MGLIFALLAVIMLLVLSAFFSGSESALFSLDSLQVRRIIEKKPTAGRRIEKLLATPSQLLSGILIGNTLVNVATSSIAHGVIERLMPKYGVFLAVPVITTLLLVFGEVSPKRLALRIPERVAAWIALPIYVATMAMKPLSGFFNAIDRRLQLSSGSANLTEEEYRGALIEGEEGGLLKREERGVMEGILRLEAISAADVMTPRVDLVGIDFDMDDQEIRQKIRSAHFKYVPVYEDSLDNILGFLDVKKFLLAPSGSLESRVITTPFVPETMPLDKLLLLFRKESIRVVCVTDEFGGTAGIVTQGDVAEEIVADTDQDLGSALVGIKALGPSRWLVGGHTSIHDVNARLGTKIETGNYNRIGGWISDQLDRIPRRGDVAMHEQSRIIVHAVKNRRIISVIFENRKKEDLT
jgi:putative hemolysin